MQYAKSIYRGGFIADADACDYTSSRELGLKCPFCHEAVFWRQGSQFIRAGKTILIRPSFCHYGSSAEAKSCELRSIRREGQEYVQQLAAVAKGQRLDLYNERLWQMFCESVEQADGNYKGGIKIILKLIRKSFGERWVHNKAKEAQKDVAANLADWHQDMDQTFLSQIKAARSRTHVKTSSVDRLLSKILTEAEYEARLDEISAFDETIHLTICHEILDFLVTPTGFYAYEKLFYWHLWTLCGIRWLQTYQEAPDIAAIPAFMSKIKTLPLDQHTMGIPLSLIKVNWVKFCY